MSNHQQSSYTGLEIAIVGMACRVPGAGDVEAFWRLLVEGREAITTFSESELLAQGVPAATLADPTYVRAKGVLEGADTFDADFFGMSAREAEITDPQHRVFLEVAWEALEDAGLAARAEGAAIGVYAGTSPNTYLWGALLEQLRRGEIGQSELMIGNDKDYLATRVGYKLDLRGPALTVQCACSTSLVAVHLACQALIAGECQAALAGGVSVRFPQIAGYPYRPGGIHSPDGHCRAFDARAAGTVDGNGVGVVVLKRLEDALAAGDRVRAVIRGSAVNNDGAGKIGYTAPSVDGQRDVIRSAQTAAGVDPAEIGYVEAHGTGTPLGDPIEIRALIEAFASDTPRAQPCPIGSVKTNIGHLDAAAGIAGLIKTVLIVERGLIPPSLHFQEANPRTGLDGSGFVVNAALQPWDGPRLAGVSSFGIGGTNAHVVVEQPPPPRAATRSERPWLVLTISARTATAAARGAMALADHLAEHPELDLADVAYTTMVGRQSFAYRTAVVCRDRQDAIEGLRDRGRTMMGTVTRAPRIAFLFPGQGTQYAGMGRALYQQEPSFRAHLDRCAELFRPHLGRDLRDILFATEGAQAELIGQTRFTQPALFAIEHALARSLLDLGIEPVAMLGHSIGEYVAASLAGVLALEHAAALVAARGAAMQEMPPGEMLAVSAPVDQVAGLLGDDLDIAADNAPALCVVSGPAAAVARLRERLQELRIPCRVLRTSHAFHSAMMEPASRMVADRARAMATLSPPRIPFLSNVSGTWITAEEAQDPAYWGRQVRARVRFRDGLNELRATQPSLLLEIGPGRTLSTLAGQQGTELARLPAVSVLPHASQDTDAAWTWTNALARLWVAGAPVRWRDHHGDMPAALVTLPAYAFDRRRYWLGPGVAGQGLAVAAQAFAEPVGHEPAAPVEQGAIHVNAVPSPGHERPALTTPYAPPGTETEELLAALCATLLRIDRVGVHDSFFDLGGNSLLGMHLVERIRDAFGVDVPIAAIYEHATVADLALLIESLIIDQIASSSGNTHEEQNR
jgi:phthiocerol/phenolphthiocerol synthesis type-I polyketide synthase E